MHSVYAPRISKRERGALLLEDILHGGATGSLSLSTFPPYTANVTAVGGGSPFVQFDSHSRAPVEQLAKQAGGAALSFPTSAKTLEVVVIPRSYHTFSKKKKEPLLLWKGPGGHSAFSRKGERVFADLHRDDTNVELRDSATTECPGPLAPPSVAHGGVRRELRGDSLCGGMALEALVPQASLYVASRAPAVAKSQAPQQ